jgi:hypothetical protein
MKSRFQRKTLRTSRRRKIQKGGMSVDDAIKLLTSYGCSGKEASMVSTIMTKDRKVDDAVMHGAIFLHTQRKKSWKDAALLSLSSKGNMNTINLFVK